MAEDDVNDIFKDFEHKVDGKEEVAHESKKEAHKSPEKKLSEEEHLKKKYQNAEQALKDKFKKEKEVLQDKRKKEITGHGEMHGKNSPSIEKVAYVGIILVLAAYVAIDLSFYHGLGVDTSDPAVTAAAVQENNTTNEIEVVEETVEEVVVVEEEKELSGVVTLDIDNIYKEVSDGNSDLGYISKIIFTIDNGKDEALTPVLEVFAYDSEMEESWETTSRGKYLGAAIESGEKSTGSIDLSPKSFRNLDIKKDIRLTLNSTEDGFLTSVNEKVAIE